MLLVTNHSLDDVVCIPSLDDVVVISSLDVVVVMPSLDVVVVMPSLDVVVVIPSIDVAGTLDNGVAEMLIVPTGGVIIVTPPITPLPIELVATTENV